MRPRSPAELEDPAEVVRSVDVERHEGIIDDSGLDAETPGALDGDGGTGGYSEGRLEDVGGAEGERVGSAVLGRAESNWTCLLDEQIERLGPNQGAIGHDDERTGGRARVSERRRDSGCMARARVAEDFDPERSKRRLGRYDEHRRHQLSMLACIDDVPEHRANELRPLLGGKQRAKTSFPRGRRIDRDDGEH